jgi:hypothetical protein
MFSQNLHKDAFALSYARLDRGRACKPFLLLYKMFCPKQKPNTFVVLGFAL